MLPPALAEQQAKLGVSADESKAQRLKRQQARFRDRGGAFVPSGSNPLVDILLSRTVSGESPSKACPKDVSAKRLSPSKARQALPTRRASTTTASGENQAVAASSKSKLPASRKRSGRTTNLEVDPTTQPTSKRRGRPAKGKKKAPDADSDTVHPLPRPNSRSTLKGKGKQHDVGAVSSTDGKPKPKAEIKSNPAKAVVEELASDDDRTLVEVPHKSKSKSNKIRHGNGGEVDDDSPNIQKRALLPTEDPRASSTKTASRVRAGKIAGMGSSRKTTEDKEIVVYGEGHPKTNSKKRIIPRDDDDVVSPVVKKGRVANSAQGKSKITVESQLALNAIKEAEVRDDHKIRGNGKRRRRPEPDQRSVEPVERDEEQYLDRAAKPKKRKKEDKYDNWPRKTIRFSDISPPRSSSKKLKENQSNKRQNGVPKSRAEVELDASPLNSATEPPSRIKRLKGPPREVLERIKASAVRHLQCADSEPDELDCLS